MRRVRLRGARGERSVGVNGTQRPSEFPCDLPERELIAAAVANVTRCGMRPWGLHGLAHWWRVRHNGLLVAGELGARPAVVTLFAIFHDSHRHDDRSDPEHGPRAADWLRKVREGDADAHGACATTRLTLRALEPDSFESLRTACALHTTARTHDDPSVAACFIADRLDLSRVGHRPNPRFMPAAPQLVTPELIDAAIARERAGLKWDGGAQIETVWGKTAPRP